MNTHEIHSRVIATQAQPKMRQVIVDTADLIDTIKELDAWNAQIFSIEDDRGGDGGGWVINYKD